MSKYAFKVGEEVVYESVLGVRKNAKVVAINKAIPYPILCDVEGETLTFNVDGSQYKTMESPRILKKGVLKDYSEKLKKNNFKLWNIVLICLLLASIYLHALRIYELRKQTEIITKMYHKTNELTAKLKGGFK